MDQGRAWLCCQTRGQSSRLLSLSALLPSFFSEHTFGEENLRQTAWNEPETTMKDSERRTIFCSRKEITGTVHNIWLEGEVPHPMMSGVDTLASPIYVGEFKNRKGWTVVVTALHTRPQAPPSLLLISLHISPYAQELMDATQL